MTTPLVEIEIGLVSQFVLDPMHLVFLGVVRTLLYLWLKGPLSVRLCSVKKTLISDKIVEIAKYMPAEFARKPPLDELERFKATEFRSFLLYSGPIALENVLDHNIYKNFILLTCAITLLSRNDIENVTFSRQYLLTFVTHYAKLYGECNVVYNVHNLIHLSDDASRYGTIDKFSAFPFESKLGFIKKLVRQPNLPLQQVINRIAEKEANEQNLLNNNYCKFYPILKKPHFDGPLLNDQHYSQFRELYLETFCLKLTQSDSGAMIKNDVCAVKNILSSDNNQIHVVYKVFKDKRDLFDYPTKSSELGIYKIPAGSIDNNLKSCSLDAIKCKYVLINLKNYIYAIPLLHTCHPQ